MKMILAIMAAVLVLGSLAGGLSALAFNTSNDGDGYAQPQEEHLTIELGIGGTYKVVLDSNPSTGYQWQIGFDGTLIELVDRRFELDSNLNPPPPGTGGKETFIFRGLAEGTADVVFTYKRPWEDEVLKTEQVTFEVDGDAVGGKLSLSEAMEIAMNCECAKEGTLTGPAFYNEDTGTWWIDLDAKDKKEYCNPACVVNEATGEAEINWRCTGALPPK